MKECQRENMEKQIKFLVLMNFIGFILMGCGGGKAQRAQSEIAQSDLQDLSSFNSLGAQQVDNQYNGRFSQIFGGQSGEDVRGFIQERLKYFLSKSDIVKVEPYPKYGTQFDRDELYLGFNFGTYLWLQGLSDKIIHSVTLADGQKIVVDQSRVGILVFGKNFSDHILPEGRQSLLIHEARHSDCNGGLTQTQISHLETQVSLYGVDHGTDRAISSKLFPSKCGHPHRLCQKGSYQGLPACDSHEWGSYSVQLVFLKAVLNTISQDPTSQRWQQVYSLWIDAKSRLEFEKHSWDAFSTMMLDTASHPELTSLGLQP